MPKSPNPTDKHVGTRVRMRRLMLGLTQTELANALGITFQQIQKYEKGVNRISAGKLQQLSSLLQAPIPFFFEGLPSAPEKPVKKDDGPLPSDVFQFLATSDGVSLAKAFMQIKSPKLRHCIVSLAEELTSKASR
jgi:transcriptional regulator with XRE-family HTH domain